MSSKPTISLLWLFPIWRTLWVLGISLIGVVINLQRNTFYLLNRSFCKGPLLVVILDTVSSHLDECWYAKIPYMFFSLYK